MPTNKKFDDEESVKYENEDIQLELEIDNECMDEEKLKLIYNRMYSLAMNIEGDKISRRDFLERI